MAGRLHVEPLQGIRLVAGAQFIKPFRRIRELRLELRSNFGANFVATAGDGRADSSEQVSRLRTKMHLHLANRLYNDSLQSSAPACMHRGHGALLWINEKNRNAVGRLDGKQQAQLIRNRGVAPTRFCRGAAEEMNDVRVNLAETD